MHCVPQHFVSVHYSFLVNLCPRENRAQKPASLVLPLGNEPLVWTTTTTSNAYLLSIYSLFLSDPQQTRCAESRYDATRRTSTIHKYIFQIVPHAQHPQEFSFLTPVTRHGHPCNPDNVYWETSMVEAPT